MRALLVRIVWAFALLMGLALGAHAATVASAATGSGSVGGFVMNGGEAMIDVSHSAYTSNPGDTDPPSTWVWDKAGAQSQPVTNFFVWTFDLTGFDASSAAIEGLWAVDNVGTARLNGAVISEISFGYAAFQSLTPVLEKGQTPNFLAGINTLEFETYNGVPNKPNAKPGPGAFRAGVTVSADALAVVPLPATALFLGGGLLALALLRRRL